MPFLAGLKKKIQMYSKENQRKYTSRFFYSAFIRMKPTHGEAGKIERSNNLKIKVFLVEQWQLDFFFSFFFFPLKNFVPGAMGEGKDLKWETAYMNIEMGLIS